MGKESLRDCGYFYVPYDWDDEEYWKLLETFSIPFPEKEEFLKRVKEQDEKRMVKENKRG